MRAVYHAITFKQRCYSLSLSLALHLGLATLLLCSYVTTTQAPAIGVNAATTVHSYIAPQTFAKAAASIAKPKTRPPLPVAATGSLVTEDDIDDDTDNIASQTSATQPTTAVTSPPAASSGDHQDALLTLLHNAILAKQHYPSSALTMKRHGTVQVGFLLKSDGTVHDIQLLHSSGTVSLDQAALQAIGDASPFQGVAAYLTQDKHFNLDVVFTLPT